MSTEMFEEFVRITESVHSFSSLVRVFLKSMKEHGYTNVVLFRLKAGRLAAMPVAQLEESVANCYLNTRTNGVNPIFEHLRHASQPFYWFDLEHQSNLSADQKIMMKQFEQAGAVSGLTIPLPATEGEQAMICLSSEVRDAVRQEDLPVINAKCMQFWMALNRLDEAEKVQEEEMFLEILTPRELECLELCLHFETTKSIAHYLDRAEQTVQFHISNAIHKLEVQNRTQAVARACMLGLIGKSLLTEQ